jgi:hypothetical protein
MYRRGLIAALMGAAVLVLALPAWGHHIPGATYTGTHAQGGSVRIVVSSDGSEISRFAATNIHGETCTVPSVDISYTPGTGPHIDRDHQFVADGFGLAYEGDFDARKAVHGSLSLSGSAAPCNSDSIAYTATTTASARNSSECIESRALLRKARRSLTRARRALRRAHTRAARRRAKSRVNKAKRSVRSAKADVRSDC